MPEISVIVPVYNVEKYIDRCITSILAQTFRDFELILVDDGSPDNCGSICDAYAGQDPRIVVIHQENQGLSAARNAGIDWVFAHSNSAWIHFVDSDDWVHPQILEQLLAASQSLDTDISVCDFIQADTDAVQYPSISRKPVLIHWEELYQDYHKAVYAWGKLYRRECFAQLRYPIGRQYEDGFLVHRLLYNRRIAMLSEPCYYYRITPDSITRRDWTPQRMDSLEAIESQIRFLRGLHNRKLLTCTINRYFLCSFYILIQINRRQDRIRNVRYTGTCLRNMLGSAVYCALHGINLCPAVRECTQLVFAHLAKAFHRSR